jgi:hypothetical protein
LQLHREVPLPFRFFVTLAGVANLERVRSDGNRLVDFRMPRLLLRSLRFKVGQSRRCAFEVLWGVAKAGDRVLDRGARRDRAQSALDSVVQQAETCRGRRPLAIKFTLTYIMWNWVALAPARSVAGAGSAHVAVLSSRQFMCFGRCATTD